MMISNSLSVKPKHLLYNHKVRKQRCSYIKAKGKDEECDHENYQVFQHKNITYNHHVNLQDIDDHLDAVHKLKKEDKEEYFMANGLDYNRCYEYINVVKYLNRCWRTTYKNTESNKQSSKSDNKDHKKFIVPGWSIIGIFAFIYYVVKDDL